jgi:hypothetical protein
MTSEKNIKFTDVSISTNNIDEPDSMKLIEISDIFNINDLRLNYYESIFEIKFYDILVGVVNYKILPSMRKNIIYIRNIHYNNEKYLNEIITKFCEYFKNYIIQTSSDTDPINDKCIQVMRNNNFKGDKVIFYNN